MPNSLTDSATQLKAIIQTMSVGKLITLAVLVLGTVAGIIALVSWSSQPDYMPLYSNLSAEDAGEVVAVLREQKTPYKLSHDGGTIQIPRSQIYDMRLSLAAEGLPRGSGVGFEVFDNTKLGMTEFVQNINYQRALQGELSRTINGLGEVESSRVHIVMSQQSLFIDEEEPASASVILKVRHGRWLREDQIQGIVHLVSSSVPRLAPQHVTIVDHNGKLLAGDEDQPTAATVSADHLEFQQRKEKMLEKRVSTMLEQVLGKGKAIVRVACDLDFVQQEKTEELYLPENQVVRSEQVSSETSTQAGKNPQGVPGLASNINKSTTGIGQNSVATDIQKRDQTRNYEIGKMISRHILPTGQLKRLSVAVIVDGTYETVTVGKGDKMREKTNYIARSDEEMVKLANIVKRAVNFDDARGDKVEVANISFTKEQIDLAADDQGGMQWVNMLKPFASLLKYIAAAVFVLFTFIFIVKPLIGWLTETSWEDVELLEHLPRSIAELEQQYSQGGNASASGSAVNQAAQLLASNQDNTARLMQEWMKET
jgi:flagellar M-ring protein FliF